MTQSEKLQKVIERAVKNGWPLPKETNRKLYYVDQYGGIDYTYECWIRHIESLMFDHEFAKAYFGIDENDQLGEKQGLYMSYETIYFRGKLWQYHIQQLALTPPSERIDYLFSFIKNEKK